ncbi:MAG: Fuc2NAc and GlcNAc transferase [Enterobacterales bacterium]|jgi:Fuc2NAc and GlcNAc transferase
MTFDSYSFLGIIFSLAGLLTVIGIVYYKQLANRFGIVAKKNFRTLHEVDVPRGSGVILGLVFLFFLIILWCFAYINDSIFSILLIGGLSSTLFGLLDDIMDIKARIKLIIQLLLSVMILYSLNDKSKLIVEQFSFLTIIGIILLFIAVAWFLNLVNFMDGADGLLATCTCCVCVMLFGLLYLNHSDLDVMILSGLLAVVCLAFLLFNWPPASVFMGDAGSLFIAFVLGVFIINTIDKSISPWLWLIMLGYILTDTCLTLLLRIILVKKWYGAHRSHAYQNFVRIRGEHKTALYIILAYHLFWLMPLLVLANTYQTYEIAFALLAVLPVSCGTIKYGPLLSKD